MTKEQYTRWMCFVEAFHLLEENGIKLEFDINSNKSPVAQKAIDRYITDRFPSLFEKLKREGFDETIVELN
jgi:hypothetical protein